MLETLHDGEPTSLFGYVLPVGLGLVAVVVTRLDGRRAFAAGVAVGAGLILLAAGLSAWENRLDG